jgi:DNA-binding NarL/FixJ family response regulator
MRVALADDAVILREGLSRLLEEAGFEVVGLAAEAEALLELIERTQPDAAIIDIRMPPTHTDEGLRAAKSSASDGRRSGFLFSPSTSTPATHSNSSPQGPTASGTYSKSASPT